MPTPRIVLDILDPRGRCNRRGLLIAALVMMAVQAAAGLWLWLSGRGIDEPVVLVLKAVSIYAAVSVAAQRLHDAGLSAWRILWATLALLAWSAGLGLALIMSLPPEQLQPGAIGFSIMLSGVSLPMLAMLTWMHLAPGEPRANRFGPVPRGNGFSRRERQNRPRQSADASTPA